MSDKWGTFWTIVIGLFLLNLTACQSTGFNRGIKDSKRYYAGYKVRTWAYPYGYMRGWEYQKLKEARERKLEQLNNTIKIMEEIDKKWEREKIEMMKPENIQKDVDETLKEMEKREEIKPIEANPKGVLTPLRDGFGGSK
jgi:hypothetical protein